LERELRILRGVEEVGGLGMLGADGVAGVDGSSLDVELDRRGGRLGAIDVDPAAEVFEPSAHFAHHVTDLKRGLGMRLVDDERFGEERGGGQDECCSCNGAELHWVLLLSMNCWLLCARVLSSRSTRLASSVFFRMPRT